LEKRTKQYIFALEKRARTCFFSHANVKQVGKITYLPIYMVAFLEKNKRVNLTFKPDMTGLY